MADRDKDYLSHKERKQGFQNDCAIQFRSRQQKFNLLPSVSAFFSFFLKYKISYWTFEQSQTTAFIIKHKCWDSQGKWNSIKSNIIKSNGASSALPLTAEIALLVLEGKGTMVHLERETFSGSFPNLRQKYRKISIKRCSWVILVSHVPSVRETKG